MESVKFLKEIKWEKVLGGKPRIKNRKVIIFDDDSEKALTRIVKVKIDNKEYIMNHYNSEKLEEISIKNNRALSLLELKYDKKNNTGLKKVNYEFVEVIAYFLITFFEKRLRNDKEFNSIKKILEEYEEISLEINESAI